eukprot:1909762-Pyramimonas_sp.AAC.1
MGGPPSRTHPGTSRNNLPAARSALTRAIGCPTGEANDIDAPNFRNQMASADTFGNFGGRGG